MSAGSRWASSSARGNGQAGVVLANQDQHGAPYGVGLRAWRP
ncbi:MAG: hypothetical protein ACRDNW_05175 [Trebonia sp.]